jgi:tetratricopeptide (TPR) repeat protein
MGIQQRAVIEQSLSRAASLPAAHPIRIDLLCRLARAWETDRNLLRSLSYLEQAAAAIEHLTPEERESLPIRMSLTGWSSQIDANGSVYMQLFDIYRKLGRNQDAARVPERAAAHVLNSGSMIASFEKQLDRPDEAVAIYSRLAAEASDPAGSAEALYSLAELYHQQKRYVDAIMTTRQAINRLESSMREDYWYLTLWMRQSVADMLREAGEPEAAEQEYRALIDESQNAPRYAQIPIISHYARYLAATSRGSAAVQLVKQYSAAHLDLRPDQQLMLENTVAELDPDAPSASNKGRSSSPVDSARPSTPSTQARESPVTKALQAVNLNGSPADAMVLITQAIDGVSSAADLNLVVERLPGFANALAFHKANAEATEVYKRLLDLAERWAVADRGPLLKVEQKRFESLALSPGSADTEEAEREYREDLIKLRGETTGWLEDVLYVRARCGGRVAAPVAAKELLALEETLNGNTSEPYMAALDAIANFSESYDLEGAAALRAKIVPIADLLYNTHDICRGWVRIRVAMMYAVLRRFDEARAMSNEALAIAQIAGRPNEFAASVRSIEESMKANAR